MYAIVKTGGKQYRVERGQSLLVERLPADQGASVELQPLLFVDGSDVHDGEDLAKVKVSARVLGHERGPKLRVVKFKPKRGYKRRTGHRQELTRIEVTDIKLGARRNRASAAATEEKAQPQASAPASASAERVAETKPPTRTPPASKADAETKPAARKPRARKPPAPKEEKTDGS